MVGEEALETDPDLAHVARTLGDLSHADGVGISREGHPGEDGNDAHHDKEFDQRESMSRCSSRGWS